MNSSRDDLDAGANSGGVPNLEELGSLGGGSAAPSASPSGRDPLAVAIFSDGLVRDLGALPFEVAQLVSGHEHWSLAEKEKDALGKVGGIYIRERLKLDPRSALDLFFWGTIAALVIPRAVAETKIILESRKAASEKKTDAPAA